MKRSLDRLASEPKVPCPRLDRARAVEEHVDCPYCFGSPEDVASGRRERFCDFEPGRDPVVFGFPEGSGHISKG
jgi:hypothetical protein